LKKKIQTQAIEHGDFLLKSGERSSYYIDLRRVTLQSEGLRLIVQCIADMGVHFDAIGGPCVGADPIVGAFLHTKDNLRGFLVRKEAKDHGIDGLIIGSVKPEDRCIIVEDVTTSGGSLLRACQIVQKFGCEIAEVVSVVDRNAGATELFQENGIKFSSLLSIEGLLE
tara:strand:+ start:4255 stop:4758 length:504 start_codon:yes stop_codon:yes gene_type:complete